MKSPNNKTQQHRTKVKNLSAVLAIGLAIVTLFQAGTVKSEKAVTSKSNMEVEFIAEIDDWFASEEMDLEQMLLEDAIVETANYKVYDADGQLLMEGDPAQNESLRQLINKAEFMSEFSGQQYYALTK